MTQETMTIHKALCELKTIDDRIRKEIDSGLFVFSNKSANKVVRGVDIDKFCDEQKSRYQSVKDLIERKNAIKRAVIMSNATTKVIIGGKEYFVAEAIYMKNAGLDSLQLLLEKLSVDNRRARLEAEQNNGKAIEDRADQHVSTLYSNYDKKDMSEAMKQSRDEFIRQQMLLVVDPINVTEKMNELRAKIDSFLVDVDSALSVSNALTTITIEY